jgi:hypothetical protein
MLHSTWGLRSVFVNVIWLLQVYLVMPQQHRLKPTQHGMHIFVLEKEEQQRQLDMHRGVNRRS